MTEEELRLKLGLDTTELDSGTRRALSSLANFGQESHKSFLHGDSAARGFRKTIHELSDQVPVLGTLLRVAVSPVGGTFMAAAGAIGFATKALEAFNAKLEAVGKVNAQGSGARAVSPLARLIQGETASKAAADAAASGKPSLTAEQTLRRDQGLAHAGQALKVIGDKIAGDAANASPDPSKMDWLNPSSYMDAFQGAALSVANHGWRSLLKPGFARRALEEQNTKESITAAHNEALRSRVEDAQLMLQHAAPGGPGASVKGFNWWEGLGLKQAAGMSAILAQRGSRWLNGLPLSGTLVNHMPTLDEAGGIAYKALPGAPGYIPPTAAPAAAQNPATPLGNLILALTNALQNGFPIIGKQQ